jgi:hypothetical protein
VTAARIAIAGELPASLLTSAPDLRAAGHNRLPRVETATCGSPTSQSESLTIINLIFSIAREGLRPRGQTSVQFMIERHRNNRYGSFKSSKRSCVARSRLSVMNR